MASSTDLFANSEERTPAILVSRPECQSTFLVVLLTSQFVLLGTQALLGDLDLGLNLREGPIVRGRGRLGLLQLALLPAECQMIIAMNEQT